MGGCRGASACFRIKAGAWIERRPRFPNSAEENTARALKRSRYLWRSHALPRAAARTGQRAGRRASLWDARQTTRLRDRGGSNGVSRLRGHAADRKSTRLNSSHLVISYAVFCLKKKKKKTNRSVRNTYKNDSCIDIV